MMGQGDKYVGLRIIGGRTSARDFISHGCEGYRAGWTFRLAIVWHGFDSDQIAV